MCRVFLVLILLAPFQGINDREAERKARQLWGDKGGLAIRFRSGKPPKWVYQVGCKLNKVFIIVGEGDSWEHAFSEVNMYLNGPNLTWAKGVHMCTSIRMRTSVADPS